MTDERQNWRKAFEVIGPSQLRLRLEHRRTELPNEYAREAEIWLLEKDAEAAALEAYRFRKLLRWTIVAGVAGVLAALAACIAAWPVIREWFNG
jgi:hypothetical protein